MMAVVCGGGGRGRKASFGCGGGVGTRAVGYPLVQCKTDKFLKLLENTSALS